MSIKIYKNIDFSCRILVTCWRIIHRNIFGPNKFRKVINRQLIPVYRVADYNAWIFLFLPVSFYLAYCPEYHNSRLSLFILIYCAL